MKYVYLSSFALLLPINPVLDNRVMADVPPNNCKGCIYDKTNNFMNCGPGPIVPREQHEKMLPCLVTGMNINCGPYRWCRTSSGFTSECHPTGWCDKGTSVQ